MYSFNNEIIFIALQWFGRPSIKLILDIDSVLGLMMSTDMGVARFIMTQCNY